MPLRGGNQQARADTEEITAGPVGRCRRLYLVSGHKPPTRTTEWGQAQRERLKGIEPSSSVWKTERAFCDQGQNTNPQFSVPQDTPGNKGVRVQLLTKCSPKSSLGGASGASLFCLDHLAAEAESLLLVNQTAHPRSSSSDHRRA